MWRRLPLTILALACATTVAAAEPGAVAAAEPNAVAAAEPGVTATLGPEPAPARTHLVYVDLFGKGGLWGLGYEWRTGRFAFGAVGSFYMLGGDRFTTLSPYAAVYPVRGEHHAWFVHLGPQFVHHTTPSPFPEWQGMTTSSFDVELSTGYEYRWDHLVTRFYAMASLGGHLVPWLGMSLGWSL